MFNKHDFQSTFNSFKRKLDQPFQLKSIFFDMDGVLFDSMPLHAKSWLQAFSEYGLTLPEYEPYMNEGSTAFYTVEQMFRKYLNREASPAIAEEIKNRKHDIMSTMPESVVMEHMPELLAGIAVQDIDCWVVTGSAQARLYDRLDAVFNGSFKREKMITAHDVTNGKPDPEPYLMAIKKSGFGVHQAIVIENAPLGVQSSKAAGLFTIAINTGPLEPDVLTRAGADLVLPGSLELKNYWPMISEILTQ